MKQFWTEKAWPWIRKYLLAPLPMILIVAAGILLVVLGVKNVQIGGLLAKLTGRKEGTKAVDVANTLPEDRVDQDGKVIPVGTPDEKGMTQAVVVPIESPGLFSNPDQVVINHPEEGKKVIDLPVGVKASDVDKVVVIEPEVVAVTVKPTSKIPSTQRVDDLLAKYKKK